MSLKQEIMAALTGANLSPLHRFGQNFMIDAAAVACIVDSLGVQNGDRVVEVGPGTGVLTERLLALGARVTAVEIDRGLHGYLSEHFAAAILSETLSLIHGDCLENKNTLHSGIISVAAAGPWRLGANLPYDVALPVLLNAAALPQPPTLVVVTVQREAADRLCSRPGSEAWGASAATMQAAGVTTMVRKLPPDCFYPRPRVDSAILRWEPHAPLPQGFGRWCRMMFTARRKVLTRALRDHGMERDAAEAVVRTCGLEAERRLESLDAPELLALYRVVSAAGMQAGNEGVDHE